MTTTHPASPHAGPLAIEFLYLDLDTCTRCQGAEANLDAAIAEAAAQLGARGAPVTVEKVHVETLEQARALRFAASPTIRVNGRDVALEVKENACDACSAIAQAPVTCRAWPYEGAEHAVPPVPMIVEALLRAAADGPAAEPPAPLDEANLARFFAGKAGAADCAGGGCGCGG